MTSEVLTVKEVASLLKLAAKTVYSMAQQGELPAFKVRGQWRFRLSDMDRWIEDRKLEAPGARTRRAACRTTRRRRRGGEHG